MKKNILLKILILFAAITLVLMVAAGLYPNSENISDTYEYVPDPTPTQAKVEPTQQAPSVDEPLQMTQTVTEESYSFSEDSWSYMGPEMTVNITRGIIYGCDVYIAHIMLSDMSYVSSGFAGEKLPPKSTQTVDKIAQNYHSILAVNGDYLTKDANIYNSPIIKNGELIRDGTNNDILAVMPDKLQIFFKSEGASFDVLIEAGVTETYAFGPVLVSEGQIYPEAYTHRLRRPYPRCAVGQVEPGHIIVMVVEGNDDVRGITLAQLAKMFKDEGAEIAYNLDAGQTPSMVFMGVPINIQSEEEYNLQKETSDIICFGTSESSPEMVEFDKIFGE